MRELIVKQLVMFLGLLIVLLAGCTRKQPPQVLPIPPHRQTQASATQSSQEQDDLEVLVVVFRHWLKGASTGETCFLGIESNEGGKLSDPPDSLIKRIGMPDLVLRKVSEAQFTNLVPEQDPITGKPIYVYYVRVTSHESDKATARSGKFNGPLGGRGYEVFLARQDNKWFLNGTGAVWQN